MQSLPAFCRLAVMPALLALSTTSSPSAASAQVSIPFATTSDGFVLVPATLGDTMTVHVIVDTGSGLDVLAPSIVRKLHGLPRGRFTGFRMRGDRIDIPLFVIPRLSFGPLVKNDVLVGTWDLLDSVRVDGVISMNDFRQQPFTLDFVDHVVVFETPETLAHRRADGASWPIQFDDLRGISLDLFARFEIGDQSGQCSIDTGSPTATVSTRYAQPVSRIALPGNPAFDLIHPRVSVSNIIYDCVIGIDFWAGRVLTVDIPNRRLIIARPAAKH